MSRSPQKKTHHFSFSPQEMAASRTGQMAEDFGRRIALALYQERFEQAKTILNEAVYELAVSELLPDRPLEEINVNQRIRNMLEESFGVFCIRDLKNITVSQLLAVSNVSIGTVDHIWQAVLTAVCNGGPDNGEA